MAWMSLQQRVWHLNWLNATTVTPVLSLSVSRSTLSSLVSMTDKTSLHLRWKDILKLKGAALLLLSCTGSQPQTWDYSTSDFWWGHRASLQDANLSALGPEWYTGPFICHVCVFIVVSSSCISLWGNIWLFISFPRLGWIFEGFRFISYYKIELKAELCKTYETSDRTHWQKHKKVEEILSISS